MFQGKIRTGKDSYTVLLNNQSYSFDRNHKNYDKLRELYMANNSEGFEELFNFKVHENVETFVASAAPVEEFEFKDGKIFMNGEELHGTIVRRINEMMSEGEDFQFMLNFLRNIDKNVSARAKNEAYDFIANQNIPITEDGCILAYKSVQSDFHSKYAGTLKLVQGTTREDGRIFNGVGEVIECDRSKVDDDRARQCSFGLHAGGLSYSGPGGWYNTQSDKIVIIKVNPADIVAVPTEMNATKMRVCKYTVLSEFVRPLTSTVEREEDVTRPENEEVDDDFYDEEEYEDDDEDWMDEEDEEEVDWSQDDDEDEDFFRKNNPDEFGEPLVRRQRPVRKLTEIDEPVTVMYKNQVRSVVFKEEFEDHYIVQLSEHDCKYDEDAENIRNFKKEKLHIL